MTKGTGTDFQAMEQHVQELFCLGEFKETEGACDGTRCPGRQEWQGARLGELVRVGPHRPVDAQRSVAVGK